MPTVYLSLGSNIEDRQHFIQEGINALGETGFVKLQKVSSIYETEPVGFEKQNYFLNVVVSCFVELSPEELLWQCKRIENQIGRRASVRWGPRKLDIDILCYGSEKIVTKNIIIPHPEMLKRNFVLIPFAEIAEDFIIPGVEVPVKKAVQDCKDKKPVILYRA